MQIVDRNQLESFICHTHRIVTFFANCLYAICTLPAIEFVLIVDCAGRIDCGEEHREQVITSYDSEVIARSRRMLENGATRQQIADVIGVGVKTIYKYFPAG